VKLLARWLANALAIFLGLYLLDSLLHERFHLDASYPAILAAVLLGFANSFVRPLHRARSQPLQAVIVVALTLFVNFLFLQIFVWTGAGLSTTSFAWVIVAAAFITLLTGVINWLIGFPSKERPRPTLRAKEDRPGGNKRDKGATEPPGGSKRQRT
jgi:putative membrane protein